MAITLLAHCDWGRDPAKRWMATAVRTEGVWQITRPEPVGDTGTLIDRLHVRRKEAGSVLIGFDFPIGLPTAYAKAAELPSFKEALPLLGNGQWADWFRVAEHQSEIGRHRPFYPMRPGGTSRAHLLKGHGLQEPVHLLRECERATPDRQAACSLFWTLGGNQVGKGAIAGWQEVIIPNLARIGLWPFDGSLTELAEMSETIIAETYPGDVYRWIGIKRRAGWSKRRQSDRAEAGRILLDWIAARPVIDAQAVGSAIQTGFDPDPAGEDQFDAMIGLLGMIAVVQGERGEGVPSHSLDILKLEGWILGHQR